MALYITFLELLKCIHLDKINYNFNYKKIYIRASAGRSSIRHWRKDLTNDEKKCNSFRQFDESIKSTYFK